jgi:Domain of unknown function (DUF6484)
MMRTKKTLTSVQHVGEDNAIPETAAAHIATIVALQPDGTPEVRFADGAIVGARLAVRATRAQLEIAIVRRRQTVVLFENGDRAQPLIVGFIEAIVPQVPNTADAPARDASPQTSVSLAIEADVDGRRVRLTAHDEIVLQCGSASVTLRRNGRVIIRGTYVESHSQGTNRIKGGQVQIN